MGAAGALDLTEWEQARKVWLHAIKTGWEELFFNGLSLLDSLNMKSS